FKNKKPVCGTVRSLFFFNLLIGWTGIGWFIVLADAFGYDPVAWFVRRFSPYFVNAGGGNASSQSGMPQTPGSSAMCGGCGGSGSMSCSSCGGRGSWYSQPTTASGMAQLQNCSA